MPAPRLSIIIAVPGTPAQMEDTLVSVLQNRPPACEVLVALNQPYADPYELQGEVQFLAAPAGSSLAPMLNLAVARSQAPVLHVLTCGLRVGEGWVEPALSRFEDPQVAAVVPLVVDRHGRAISAGSAYESRGRVRRLSTSSHDSVPAASRQTLIDPDFCVAFFRRTALDHVGGFAEVLGDRLTCFDLGLALQTTGYQCLLETECRVLADRRMRDPGGWYRRGRHVEQLFWRWLPQQGRWKHLLQHGWMLAGDSLRSLARPQKMLQLAGRLSGMLRSTPRRDPASLLLEPRSDEPALKGPYFARTAKVRKRETLRKVS